MEKIKSSEIGKIIKDNLKYICISALVFFLIGYFYTSSKTKNNYNAKAAVLITENKGEDLTYNSLMLNEKLANIYGEVLNSEDLYLNVAKKMNDEESADKLKNNLETEINAPAGIITFEYKDKGEKQTALALNLIIKEFRKDIKEYLGKDNIEVLQNVSVKDTSSKKPILIGIFLGLMALILSLLFIVTKEFLAGEIRSYHYFDKVEVDLLGVIDEK
ncbi:YveK family protein [Anaerococcus hydrogenalis]|uniref:Chain-length determining protein n=1 Tax=Anaerococcus hydrogenalis TaxID=33029 RepID=A0A2N6UIY1_9FIRM|nr:Wzz/FepE/Etk N-terminal domain-containing protein [Anaerococcus hydrogenalis]MBS5988125.1 chain-length determining protein [Anaerococcus hydrogenalis]MDK7694872.1 Wzz/FepE/Etk N-terminal domain-containing protein [Anaerococcus hydrogenalis]MDK7696574.1 Wzz/FepE/Etk N-terminal domain-containing protein [Anaerococcus hydrogenalis]MDK7707899.1 Wzz/FepE/Etk N-terminal domain-containing protein [Anaerococcus hydrogenalis]PMC81505.1 chain-length determining protein [Anaerococcus hydrogenalis]